MDVDLRFSEFFVDYLLVFEVMLLLESSVLVPNRHQMALNNSGHFAMFTNSSCALVLLRGFSPVFFLLGWYENHPGRDDLPIKLVLVGNNYLPVCGAIMEWIFLGRSAEVSLAVSAFRPVACGFTTGTNESVRRIPTWVISKPVHFKIPKEENVFVVLFQNDFKHELVKMFLFSFVVTVLNVKRQNSMDSMQWESSNWSCKVANRMIMVFVITERPGRKLNPPADKVFFDARLELDHFSLKQYFFIWVNNNLVNVIVLLNHWLRLLFCRLFFVLFGFLHRFFLYSGRWLLHRPWLKRCWLSGSGYISRLVASAFSKWLIVICLYFFHAVFGLFLTFLYSRIFHF